MCNNCIHKAVCSIYRATGGVKKCEHHREDRRGEWEYIQIIDSLGRYRCKTCFHYVDAGTDRNYCPNCGADMRGAEDGN